MQRTADIILVSIAFAAALAGCGAPAPSERPAQDAETSFAAFAGDVFDQLSSTPLDPAVQTSVGLFGDLNVMAGESVVMGRYRYHVDTTAGQPHGHMTFHVSPADDRAAAVPVVLEFSAPRASWRLERTTFVSAEAGPEIKAALDARLDEWVADGVRRARSDIARP